MTDAKAPQPDDARIDPPVADLGFVLDAAQLNRIESVHRGFLYQHLYAAACLLSMADLGAQTLVTERDEDIELVLSAYRLYLQVKTRNHALQWGDIKGAVEGFASIRREHAEGRRTGNPVLVVVTNAEPGPGLEAKVAEADWPQDVLIHWPGSPQNTFGLPPAWTSLTEALRWCETAARRVPFASLAPQTLVAKLAAYVQHLAAGASDHQVGAKELPALFEQFVEQLQNFPAVPDPWFPQLDEPPFDSEDRVRLLVGLAGSGKSTWAGQAASYCPGTVVYFDLGDLPPTSVATSLARELAAQLLSETERRSTGALLPNGSGLELLSAVNLHVAADESITVVLDNVHRLPYSDVRALLDTASRLRFVLLAQPWDGQSGVEAYLRRPSESFQGWDADTVAAIFAAASCAVDRSTAQRVLDLTGGLPLYVINAAQVSRDAYGSDARAFCTALGERLHFNRTLQEILVGDTFTRLGESAQTMAAVLASAEVPLTRAETDILGIAAGLSLPAVRAKALRELVACGLVQLFADGRVKLHDAARPVAGEHGDALPPDVLDSVWKALATVLQESLAALPDIRRFGRWLRLLATLGKVDVLVDIASEEHFREIGVPSELCSILSTVAADEEQSATNRFLAADALAVWSNDQGDTQAFATHVDLMRSLEATGELDARSRGILALRLVHAAGSAGSLDALHRAHQEALVLSASPQVERIVQYTYAVGLYALGQYEEAGDEALRVAEAYFDHLKLTPEDVFGVSTQELRALVITTETWQDDCKHLADCLGLFVRTCRQRGRSYGLAALHAMKFYALSGAWRSMVNMGQDAADDLVEIGDLTGALQLIDGHLLPLTNHYALVGEVIGLRSQRAVIIAWLGDPETALAQLDVLEQYDLTAEQSMDIQSQRRLIQSMPRRSISSDEVRHRGDAG